jgi:hypothetical protein
MTKKLKSDILRNYQNNEFELFKTHKERLLPLNLLKNLLSQSLNFVKLEI